MSQGETDVQLAAMLDGDLEQQGVGLARLEAGVPVGSLTVEALIGLLRHSSKALRRRAAGALAAASKEEPFRDRVITALGADDLDTRWGAAFALSQGGHDDILVFEAAIDAMGSSDGDIRWSASQIVCKYAADNPDAYDHIRARAGDANVDLRKMSLYCLRNLGSEEPVIFLAALRDPDAGVRLAALAGLARGGVCERAMLNEVETRITGDEVEGVRRAAVATLGVIAGDDAESRKILENATGSDDPDLVRAARAALRKLA